MADFLNHSQELVYPREFVVETKGGKVSIRRIPGTPRGMVIELTGLWSKESIRQLEFIVAQVTESGFHRLVLSLPNASYLAGPVGEFLKKVRGDLGPNRRCIVVALPIDTLHDANNVGGPSSVLSVERGIEKAIVRAQGCEHESVQSGDFQERLRPLLGVESHEATKVVATNSETLTVLILAIYYRALDVDPMPHGVRTIARFLEYLDPSKWSLDGAGGDISWTYGQYAEHQRAPQELSDWVRVERLVDEFSPDLDLDAILSSFSANRKGPGNRRDWYEDIDLLGRLAFGTKYLPVEWPNYQFE
jgi:hypothetical protein